jgi:hypothetical protein
MHVDAKGKRSKTAVVYLARFIGQESGQMPTVCGAADDGAMDNCSGAGTTASSFINTAVAKALAHFVAAELVESGLNYPSRHPLHFGLSFLELYGIL